MGKNRKSAGGGGQTRPKETPEQFQKRYDEARKQLKDNLSKSQIKRLLDAVLDENIHFKGVTNSIDGREGKFLMFEERFQNPDGTTFSTEINIDLDDFKEMCKKNPNISIEKLMETYRDVPEFRRKLVDKVNIGNTGRNFPGGFYAPDANGSSVNINSKLFGDYETTSQRIENIMLHEFAHSTDNLSLGYSDYATGYSAPFKNVMKNNKGSAYSESFDKGSNSYYRESLAEAVAVTSMARKYGGKNAMIENPNRLRGHYINYDKWSKENKGLADFANKFVDCKSTDEILNLFEVTEEMIW